eukprot:3795495-Rhodomonas_salina.1
MSGPDTRLPPYALATLCPVLTYPYPSPLASSPLAMRGSSDDGARRGGEMIKRGSQCGTEAAYAHPGTEDAIGLRVAWFCGSAFSPTRGAVLKLGVGC